MTRRFPLVAILVTLATVALGACGVSDGERGSSGSGTTAPDDPKSGSTTQGDAFRDEEDRYVIDVGPTWEESPSSVANGVTTWYVGSETGSLGANVNVLTQKTGDRTVQEYLDESLVGLDRFLDDSEIIDQAVTEGSEGQEIGVLEYSGSLQGEDLHFLAVATPVHDGMALATFTATDDEFAELRDSVEPYLRTLRAV